MANLSDRYYQSIAVIEQAKAEGVTFDWHQIDISDLLLAEWIADQIKPTSQKPLQGFTLIKYQFDSWRLRKKYSTNASATAYEVLVFYNSQNQWSNLQPVVNELKQQGKKALIICTKPSLMMSLMKEQFDTALLIGYRKEEFAKRKPDEMMPIIEHHLPKLNYLYHAIQPYLNSTSVKYILIGNDNTSEGRMLARIAQQKKIPTGSIQHGSMNRINPLHGRSVVDQFFVYGEKPKQELVFLGKSAQQIFVKGWPLQTEFHHHSTGQWLGFQKPTIVVTFSGPGHGTTEAHHIKCIELLATLQNELDCQLCIKLHPKDNPTYYSNLQPDKTLLWTNTDLQQMGIRFHDVIQKAQLVITGASNSALDAMLMQTDVVTLDLMRAYRDVDFVQDGLVHYCEGYAALLQVARQTIQLQKSGLSELQKKKLETYYYRFFDIDYEPTKAIVQHIQSTINFTTQ